MLKHHAGWHDFLKLCLEAKEEKMLGLLLDFFLTPEERDSIATRCLIAKELLAHEHTQRVMSKQLHVSIAKITRGSNELKRISPKLQQFFISKLLQP